MNLLAAKDLVLGLNRNTCTEPLLHGKSSRHMADMGSVLLARGTHQKDGFGLGFKEKLSMRLCFLSQDFSDQFQLPKFNSAVNLLY